MTEQSLEEREPPDELDGDAAAPRWVKAFGIVALLLLLAFVVAHLAGGGFGHHVAEHLR